MSKLYEVLENASRERERLEMAKTPMIPPCELPGWKADMEMMGLYQAMDTALGRKTSRVVQFIGSQTGEGCSTIVRNLAGAAAAKVEESVLLLDLDSRPSYSDVNNDITFQYHLEKLNVQAASPLDKAFCQTEQGNLTVSTFSTDSDPILALLDMSHDDRLWERLREQFSLILIDAPPAADSHMGFSLLGRCDGVVLVVRAEKTRWPAAVSVKKRVAQEGGKIIGAVYNDRRQYAPQWVQKYL
jgi:Mrp family chromosome partitioning ATPase